MNINLNFRQNTELFSKVANEWAAKIASAKPETKTTQMRNLYDYVLKLQEKANLKNESDFKAEILPFVKMLNSKVAYANTRKVASKEFVDMINDCVSQVNSKEGLDTFKLFFEAVLGFSKK